MIFNSESTVKKRGSFTVPENVKAVAHSCLNKSVIKEFWSNFTFGTSQLEIVETDELVFLIGNAEIPSLEDCDYSINVEKDGACIRAVSEKELVRGYVTLLDKICAVDGSDGTVAECPSCLICDRAQIKNRMVHFCVFPETKLWDIQRFVRFCGALKYTHIVIEFWGMLKYDCMKELSWQNSFCKDELRPIIREANDLGIEVIPMFNQWGHASAGRVLYGKHVVLDQNPALQTYFSEDGWCWDINKPKVRALLRDIRRELTELCGEGEYFHIGCDEAYNFEFTKENMDGIIDFINEVNDEMNGMGRRIIIWGDMLLYKHKSYSANNKYCCNAPTPEAEKYMLSRLDKNIVIADWQYDTTEAPVETAAVFTSAGFDCMLCPWDRGLSQMRAPVITVKEQRLFGFLHTTWNTISSGMPYVVIAAALGFEDIGKCKVSFIRTKAAAVLRKVMPSEGVYEKSGWNKSQLSGL